MGLKKVIRDGKVAVLVSKGYGAGWFSWNKKLPQCLFSPEIVTLLESKADPEEVERTAQSLWPNGYWSGVDGLVIEWLPVGTLFRIDEYDGAERIEKSDSVRWTIA